MTALLRAALYPNCTEGVSRKGRFQPCGSTTVAMRYDPETGDPYPVCAHHARADMVPLAKIVEGNAMNEAQRLIADVDRSHFPKSTESWLDGKTIVTRHKCACGDLYADRSTHLAAEIDAALGGLEREFTSNSSEYGRDEWSCGHERVESSPLHIDKLWDIEDGETVTIESRWVSGWTEVRP